MREVIAVCRSGKKSRIRTAGVLDRYFWRIGDRTWRGKATNACLDRVARELRHRATRNTAVTIHEIRSAHESRMPLIRIGSRSAFSDEGLVPVASHPAAVRNGSATLPSELTAGAAVRIAALFHDLGKATILFQKKLQRALQPPNSDAGQSDPIRHELHSAVVWDVLFGGDQDEELIPALAALTPGKIDQACEDAVDILVAQYQKPKQAMKLNFLEPAGSIAHLIGMLVLTHHKLPEGDTDYVKALPSRHVNTCRPLEPKTLRIARGTPFWHEKWWLSALRREASLLQPCMVFPSADIALRASLMFGDHLGSSQKQPSDTIPDHLANTTDDPKDKMCKVAADSLSTHVLRVYKRSRGAFEMLHRYRDRFPALDEGQVPVDVMFPTPSDDARFHWQAEAALAARTMCERTEGGFFACLMSGTGTGKTRAAPTILANAAIGDVRPERRYLRMCLALGLRVLATQSAREYVDYLGFRDEDVSVLVGQSPLTFDKEPPEREDGSESLIELPEWLRVERVSGRVPEEGDEREEDWLRSLSMNTDRGLPAYCDMILDAAGARADVGRRLISPPVMVGTIDHLMGVAAPINARFLIKSIRLLTSDLILDEIDQFDGEDIAAIGRLVFQAGAAGRRVIIMSATLTPDVAEALHTAYVAGWTGFALSRGLSEHVNLLCTGDAPGSCFSNGDGADMQTVMTRCRNTILPALDAAPALRRGEILPPCKKWEELIAQIDRGCSQMHKLHAARIDGFQVSVGIVRMTRISHTAAIAVQLPSGLVNGRFRVKLCLHSNLPRLHRDWIETRLKRALTRKIDGPDNGVRALCIAENLFDRTDAVGAREIEIVVITSPVIETGNDLDFDYAILDPISMRSIIQTAGRVRRHRPAAGDHPNVLILGRSPIAMQDGALERPGVETPPNRETMVAARSLKQFGERHFRDLAGDEGFARITAAALISGIGSVPLRDEEAALRCQFVCAGASAPLGKYICNLNARLTLAMTRTRRFRRSDTRDILYFQDWDELGVAEWRLDLAPGTRQSEARPATANGLRVHVIEGEFLFRDLTVSAWAEHSGGLGEMRPRDLRELMRASVRDHGRDLAPAMCYTDFTGFTRGAPEDLFFDFGKIVINQSLI